IDQLFTMYSKIIVVLSNTFLTTTVAVELEAVTPYISGLTITLTQFLIENGNKTLPTLATVPVLNPKYAHYADAFHAGYSVTPIKLGTASTSQLPMSEKTSLQLTRPNTDYNLFYNSCLVNINGFYHLTDMDTNGIYVIDGMKSRNISNHNQIGIYSFNDIGAIQLVPITPAMIYKQ